MMLLHVPVLNAMLTSVDKIDSGIIKWSQANRWDILFMKLKNACDLCADIFQLTYINKYQVIFLPRHSYTNHYWNFDPKVDTSISLSYLLCDNKKPGEKVVNIASVDYWWWGTPSGLKLITILSLKSVITGTKARWMILPCVSMFVIRPCWFTPVHGWSVNSRIGCVWRF